jgi:ubiquinone/menaquinone biosynthesis C-methylase UbiE
MQPRFVDPAVVATHFHFRDGDRIADFGAGAGNFMPALSKAIGGDGRLYACEIRKNLVESLASSAREKRLTNVQALWCDLEHPGGIKLADGALDGAVLVNTLFQLENKPAALAEMARTLRKGAKFFIVDWTESFGGLGPHGADVVSDAQAKEYAASAGLQYERDFPAGAHHYGLAFRKP